MKLLPWFFNTPLSDEESAFLRSLTVKDSSKYIEFITEYAKSFNFQEDRIAKLLNGFSMQHEKQRLAKLVSDRELNQHNFGILQKQVSDCIAKEHELNSAILGVEMLIQQGDGSGLTDYFIYNKSLHLQDVGNDSLNFVVTTYLDYFDQSVFDRFFVNPKSYFYNAQSGIAKDEQSFKKLLLALYGDDSCIRVRVCAEYKLSLAGTLSPVRTSSNLYNFPLWLPHPHIDGANCLGSNSTEINRLMIERKYIEAIEQAISATKNINFSDSAIAPRLIQSIRTGTQKFLELPNGEVVSPAAAVKWLNNKEGDD